MKIGLIDVDSHRRPNLCLMKLSAYHKAQGNDVEWWTPKGRYDLVYKSRVFMDTYSKDTITVTNADRVICGGTGCGPGPNLSDAVEHTRPDYALYPQFPDTAYGFLTRGCPNHCGFCVVSGKEGNRSVHAADPSKFWDGQKEIKLMDANLLACPDHEWLVGQLADSRALVDFSQGLDIRLITPDNVALLNKVRTKTVHFAWDNPNADLTGYFQRFSELSKIRDFRRKRVYVLTNFNSIQSQRAICLAYIESHDDLELVDTYIDDGETGSNTGRPSFQRMIQDMRSGRIDCAVSKDLSRFSRNYTDTGNYLERIFPFLDVRFIAVNDSFDTLTAGRTADGYIVPLKNIINDIYCWDISIKIRTSLEVKRKKGEYVGSCPAAGRGTMRRPAAPA